MKKIFTAIFILLSFYVSIAQSNSNCDVPDVLRVKYDRDVKHIALQRIYQQNSPYKDSIIIPNSYQDSIWKPLAAIFNNISIPQRDSVFNIYCIHQQTSYYIFNKIYIGVDTSYSWVHQWMNLHNTTGIPVLDSLLSTYGFTITNYWNFGSTGAASFQTNQNINVKPLNAMIEALNISGIQYAEPASPIGFGDQIIYNNYPPYTYFNFIIGLGDCPSGCTGSYSFNYKADTSCTATYVNTTIGGIDGHDYKYPRNCNISLGHCTTTDSIAQTICAGDSIYFFGRYIYTPGYYDTILPSATGCDTFATLTLVAIDPLPPIHIYDTICSGDSVLFNGNYVDTTGAYTAHYNPQNGCDSMVILNLTVNELPVVTFTWDSLVAEGYFWLSGNDTLFCMNNGNSVIPLAGGDPFGGYYTGVAVSGNILYVNNLGYYNIMDTITYTVSVNGCNASASDILLAVECEGINEVNANTLFTLYPNPAKDYVTIETDLSALGGTLQITDVTGRTLDRLQVTSSKLQVNTNQFSAGIYFVKLSDKQGRNATMKLAIQ